MVTYEEARQFREAAGAPLTWGEEDVPPPPLDRIEFTRLILEYAKEAKLEEIRWLSHVGMYSPVPRESQDYNISKEREIEKLKYFQQLIQRHM